MVEKMKINYTEITPITIFLFIWQFPQCLVGLILYFLFRIEPIEYTNQHTNMTVLWIPTKWSAYWSLGPFIFADYDVGERILRHETGHSMQSLYLGPLFLLAVGLPSVFLFWRRRFWHKSHEWYYEHYPENWANNLGGVTDIDNKE
jgi:hypothetical protein